MSGHPRNSLAVHGASRGASRRKVCEFLRRSRCTGVGKSPVSPVGELVSCRSAPGLDGVVGRSAVEKRGEID